MPISDIKLTQREVILWVDMNYFDETFDKTARTPIYYFNVKSSELRVVSHKKY